MRENGKRGCQIVLRGYPKGRREGDGQWVGLSPAFWGAPESKSEEPRVALGGAALVPGWLGASGRGSAASADKQRWSRRAAPRVQGQPGTGPRPHAASTRPPERGPQSVLRCKMDVSSGGFSFVNEDVSTPTA